MATYEPHDKFYRKARERGLPSRAAFKIEEIIARNRLVVAGSGARVVDLGCAPGGWLAILVAAAGAQGRVVGVDLAAVKNPPAAQSRSSATFSIASRHGARAERRLAGAPIW